VIRPARPAATTGGVINDVVELRLPADSAYLAVLRTATAGLAARLDFTLDEIEDLRIAVDEACALLLADSEPGEPMVCAFTLGDDSIEVVISARTGSGRPPGAGSFAWTVLSALAGEVKATAGADHVVTITLLKQRGGT